MAYCLLTGATGLVGSYLLDDLLEAGQAVAVVVRGSRGRSAQSRIEALMRRREKLAGRSLARPVVLTGDITQPNLGLSSADRRWVAHHCRSVLHNAASLTFVGSPGSEPWTSNVDGTRNVLELCLEAGIRQFHHVSTAYVCGLRQGIVRESDVDVGQQTGNDYEASKLEAEKMVRGADFLDSPTIYRPGIIIGDSRTGYTSTFHGFYLPLRLVCAVYGIAQEGPIQSERMMELLSLSGDETKNLVPVNWVARGIARIFLSSDRHGETYHLTPRQPVTSQMIVAAIRQAVGEAWNSGKLAPPPSATKYSHERFESFFAENMRVYQAYWRADPQFDTTNTQRALPDLPCPKVDSVMLARMCNYAIGVRFVDLPEPAVSPPLDVEQHLECRLPVQPSDADASNTLLGTLFATGPGGGQWSLAIRDNQAVSWQRGAAVDAQATCHVTTHTLKELVSGRHSLSECVALGHVLFEGPPPARTQLRQALQGLVAGAMHGPAVCDEAPRRVAPVWNGQAQPV